MQLKGFFPNINKVIGNLNTTLTNFSVALQNTDTKIEAIRATQAGTNDEIVDVGKKIGANAKSKLSAPYGRRSNAALSRSRQIPVGRKNV